jgi:uncharacterized membrane protein
MKPSVFVLHATFILLLQVCANGTILYDVIDLGTLEGHVDSYAFSVNNVGQAAGFSGRRAVLFDITGSGNVLPLGSSLLTGQYSQANSINDAGIAVGYVAFAGSGLRSHATLFQTPGNLDWIYLGALPAYPYSEARCINDAGQVVGYSRYESVLNPASRATLFDPTGHGQNVDLGNGAAHCINGIGQIVGWSSPSAGGGQATLFDPTGGKQNVYLGNLGGQNSIAYSINDAALIVGQAENDLLQPRATVFDPSGNGNNLDLGIIPGYVASVAYAVNNRGEIVGNALQGLWHGGVCIYTTLGPPILFDPTGGGANAPLNELISPDSGWRLQSATGINDSGWIVGVGRNPDGESHGYVLKPIPEPVTILLLAIGALCLRKRIPR